VPTINDYKRPDASLPKTFQAWQLHGAGFENVGSDGRPETLELREPGENEVLLRVDALGLCLSDIKIINQGSKHTRLRGRDLSKEPTILGHECAATVVKSGAKYADRFKPGERYVVQADIYFNGENYAFGYLIPGGLGEYTYVDERVIEGDEGCYLLRVDDSLGYSQSALAEPWACVEMSYNLTDERTLPGDGEVLVVSDVSITETFEGSVHVATDLAGLPDTHFDDIILFAPTPELVETLGDRLKKGGVMYVVGQPDERGVASLDIGRIHYEGIRFYGGGDTLDEISKAVARHDLKPRGNALFIGAGGPMGQMHVQRAIEVSDGPKKIVVTDSHASRLAHIETRFGDLAEINEVELVCVCRHDFETLGDLQMKLRELAPEGYDDICTLAVDAQVAADYLPLATNGALFNIFAGVGIGNRAAVPLGDLCRGVKLIGSSGSRIRDMQKVLDMVTRGELNTNLSVAAIGGLNAAKEGLEGLRDALYPGKTIIYPQIRDLGIIALPDLDEQLPEVADKLGEKGEWTKEAEAALLESYSG